MSSQSRFPNASPAVARVLTASAFVANVVREDMTTVERWLTEPPLARDEAGRNLSATVAGLIDEPDFMRALRRFRNAAMARIAARAIAEIAPLDETLGDLSDLADACCAQTLAWTQRRLSARYGVPRAAGGTEARAIVLGMGKLGGRELNFSSDIDLIFAYTQEGETDGSAAISNGEFFVKLAQDTTRLLATATADGFVFRVDTMLRPFGSVGALAIAADTMEQYYQTHGREWERYALIKARPIAGDCEAGHALLRTLRPFVYRRYLDFSAIGALRELKRMIDADARKRGAEDDLKLGPGGIRELEFIVQLFQLVRGGQDARLRDSRLRPVLRHLGETGLLPAESAQALDEAYVFLRRCENAVQMYGDLQTHKLPREDSARVALCTAMGFRDWPALLTALDAIRDRVNAEFRRLFADAGDSGGGARIDAERLWHGEPAERESILAAQGFTRAGEAAAAVAELVGSRLVRTLGDAARARLQIVLGLLAETVTEETDRDTALVRTLRVLTAIAGRTTYVALLREQPRARRQLVRLCAASLWIAELLAQTPALLDTLLDERLASEAPDRQALTAQLRRLADGVPAEDMEAVMDLLRRYRKEMTLRIAAADLSGALPLVQVSDRLTWLAEAIVAQTLDYARAQLHEQYGVPRRADGSPAEFAVVGYGKFGSIELGYGSDLDLVFVYDIDDPDAMTTGGKRALAASDFFSRFGQRVVQLLSMQTVAGRAYEVDLQLRPSGNSGLVVTRLAGFERYQRESAWTWEHQALLRARPVAGDAPLCAAVEAVRREVLMRPRDEDALRGEVASMRMRMRTNLEKHVPGRWDVKQGSGGLIDAEFLTQYLCLLRASAHASVVEYTDNWRQLEALAQTRLISAAQRDALLAAERAYRGWLHRRALQQQDGLAEDALFAEHRAAVTVLWNHFLGGG
jgi:glutamate-ammonia-ligase adenylyltransferase